MYNIGFLIVTDNVIFSFNQLHFFAALLCPFYILYRFYFTKSRFFIFGK